MRPQATASGNGEERVLLGRITGAHGLKGEVKIVAFTSNPEDVAAYGSLMSADGTRTIEIASFRGAGGGAIIARLRGIEDRNGAEALKGLELFVPRSALPPATADEYYHSDLIGLTATSVDGETLGKIIAVHNFGGGDLLELRPVQGRQTELIPFESTHVPKVDIESGCVTIVRPAYEEDESPPKGET
ncbi:MAG: ribosome maturation factor RimM [Rhodomicrobium sp.]